MTIISKTIAELSTTELLKIIQERVAVFVVEQACVYQEVDGDDYQARHLCLWGQDGQLQAYCRIIERENYVSFGRVLVAQAYRGQQFGQQIVAAALAEINLHYHGKPVKIAAQTYLRDFYGSFGFKPQSDVYLEDGIEHIDMFLQ